jgi:transcriptional regulator with XRE-family HTH domain
MSEKSFLDTLILRRKEKKLSQSELAKKAGVSRNYISQIERGNFWNVSIGVMFEICSALEMQMNLKLVNHESFQDFARPTPRAAELATPLSGEGFSKLLQLAGGEALQESPIR